MQFMVDKNCIKDINEVKPEYLCDMYNGFVFSSIYSRKFI